MVTTSNPSTRTDPLRALLLFHRSIRAALDTFDVLARDAMLGKSDPYQAAALVHFFTGPMRWHDTDERESLLKRLEKLDPSFVGEVRASVKEHEEIEGAVDDIVEHLRDLSSLVTWPEPDRLSQAAARLRSILDPHLEHEERDVFPRARDVLDANDLATMSDEMAARRQRRGPHREKP